jgi:hypothetical protein
MRVVIEPIASLFAGDTVQPVAHVLDPNGTEIRGVAIRFGTSDPTVASVTPAGQVFATGPGTVTITAWAPGLERASPGRTVTVVHGAIEIDSVLPQRVKYGSQLRIYGIGLDPSAAAAVNTGGLGAPIHSYSPVDPTHPERYGVLDVAVVPPLGKNSDEVNPIAVPITVTTTHGAASFTANLIIEPRDVYEPNDSVPFDLGVINGRFEAIGLAFDRLDPSRLSLGVDWYTFTTQNTGDWTITLKSVDAYQAQPSADFIEGSVAYTGFNPFSIWYTDSLRTIGTNFNCGGFFGAIAPVFGVVYGPGLLGPQWSATHKEMRWTLENLPPGPHTLLLGFRIPLFGSNPGVDGRSGSEIYGFALDWASPPIRYDLTIESGIHADLPPDRFEGNDFCEDAPTLLSLDSTGFADSVVDDLTIDAELDNDWFVVEAHTPGRLYLSVESDNHERHASPLLLSPIPGVGQPVSALWAESYSLWDEEQQLRSAQDNEPGVALDPKSYYLVIPPDIPRHYRMRFAWVPGAPALAASH